MLPATTNQLSRAQKAAVVIHLLLSEGADPGIAELPEPAQRKLVKALASLKFVDRDTLAQVIAEFTGELDASGLRLPGTLPLTLQALDGKISADLLSEFSADIPASESGALGSGVWGTLQDMQPEELLPLMEAETPEVCAILLSKLPATRSANLLNMMETERAAAITSAFAGTEMVPPDVVARIGMSLGRAVASKPVSGFDTTPVARVGAILNAATSGQRDALMAALEDNAPDFAARVRGAVFSWQNIPERIDPSDLPRVLREVDTDAMVKALSSDVDGPIGSFILGAISPRLADQYRNEIEDLPAVKPEEVEEAQGTVAAAIRDLEASGEISYTAAEDGEE